MICPGVRGPVSVRWLGDDQAMRLIQALGVAAVLLAGVVVAAPAVAGPGPVVPDGAIEDSAQILGAGRGAVLAAMDAFTASTGMDVTVVTTSDAGGQAIRTYATERAARLGRDRGSAVVIGADMGGRSLGIFSTPAAESRLPDRELESVVADVLTPKFKEGHYGQGIVDSLSALDRYLQNGSVAGPSDDGVSGGAIAYAVLLVLAFGGWGISAAVDARRRRAEERARASRRAALGARLKPLEPKLEALKTPRERYERAKRSTGVSVGEWNMMYPQWYYVPVASSTTHSSTQSSSSSSSSDSGGGGFSAGGFDGGGGASGSF